MNPLDYRSWGMTRDCKGCRFWSEMLARVDNGTTKAACLAPAGRGQFHPAGYTCTSWQSGELGAIDDPSGNPYEEAEAA